MSKQTLVRGSGIRQKRKFWHAHIKAWKDSNLSQAEYCLRPGLKPTACVIGLTKKSGKMRSADITLKYIKKLYAIEKEDKDLTVKERF